MVKITKSKNVAVTEDRHIETQLLHIQPADHLELADVQKKKCHT